MQMTLLEFREKYPIKPYDPVRYAGEEWEAISFPWPEDDGAVVNIRKKDEPGTMIEVDADLVEVVR